MSATPPPPVGVATFLTPCLVLAATLATTFRQLGVPVGGWSFTVSLYLVLDFTLYRLGRRQPGLARLRRSFSSPAVAPATPATSTGGTGHAIDERAAKTSQQSQQAATKGGAPAAAQGRGQVAGAAPAVASAKQQGIPAAAAAAATATAAAEAQSAGLRLSVLGTDVYVNEESPFEFENEFFKGRMLFLVKSDPPDPKWAARFEGENSSRAFEMQIQGRLKLLPKGEASDVYMGGELGQRPKQGLVTQTVSKIVMSFAKQMVKSLHYSFGERRPPSDPLDVEKPHVTFPLYRVMDWFVVTPKAEAPPALGGDLSESAEERVARRGGKSPDIVWNTDVTYTMAFQSGIVNFQDWAVTDIPGQGSLDLNTFLCKQPVSVVVYDFTAASASATTHKARDKSYMFQCTISNDSPGQVARPAAAAAVAAAAAPTEANAARTSGSTAVVGGTAATAFFGETGAGGAEGGMREPDAAEEGGDGRTAAITDDIFDEQPHSDGRASPPPPPPPSLQPRRPRLDSTGLLSGTAVFESLLQQQPGASNRSYYSPALSMPEDKDINGKGLVKSGGVLPLLTGAGSGGGEGEEAQKQQQQQQQQPSSSSSYLPPPNASHEFLGEGNGGRVAMRRGAAMPAGVQIVKVGGGEDTFRSDYLYEGDVIVLHHPASHKFVKIGRGWTLGWSSKAPASKIHFVVKGTEPGRPLAHGQAFSLSTRKRPDWEVGVAREASNKVGGRGLGCFNRGKRRNTTRLSLLTLVAIPWFDPDKEGVIPALEAEADAITISVRGPFEDVVSDEEDEEEEDGSDAVRSDVDEGMSDSEYDSDVEADRSMRTQSNSLTGDGISTKAARAMQHYPEHVASLRVSVPAWVEFLHRGRRQGQLAFLLAVRPTVPDSAAAAAAPAAPAAAVPSSLSSDATHSMSSSSASGGGGGGGGDGRAAAAAAAAAATGSTSAVGKPSNAGASAGAGAGAHAGADISTNATPSTKATEPAAAARADSSPASPSFAKPPSTPPPPPSWTCVRTGRELSGIVQAYRESIAGSTAAGSWLPKPRPRVIRHMGTADQSVQLLSHEVSEMQRWEASFWGGDDIGSSPVSKNEDVTTGPTGAPPSRNPTPLRAGANNDAASPATTPSGGDAGVSSPPLPRSPVPAAECSTKSFVDGRASSSLAISDPGAPAAKSGVAGDVSQAGGRSVPAAAHAAAAVDTRGGGRRRGGAEATAPYRLLCELVSSPGELDRHFLSGSQASDLGVSLGPSSSAPILGCAVARCLWESHWREEWVVLFPSHVACYPPLSKKPAWVLPLKTLRKASAVSDDRCPFPGLRCLRLETIGRAHYLCYTSRSSRDHWLAEILRLSKGGIVDPPSGLELSQDPQETYVLKTAQWRKPPRLVLNARRPGFDLQGVHPSAVEHHQQQQPWELSAQVLRSAFEVHADPGNKRLVPFLDLTSTFRKVDLSRLDLDSDGAVCFFGNLYHLLVRHMLLVLGPPSSAKDWPSSFVQVSYEVGGDVFSLQELEHCVLRGRLPRPSLKDFPKRFAPLPPEGDDHYAYSLGKADNRMSLFLNNGSQSNPTVVVLLSPEMLNEQLDRACQAFVDYTVKTDLKRKQILVHKVFQLYARDLKPLATPKDMVRYGLRFAGKVVIHELAALDVDISQAQIRYHPYLLKCHETMYLLDLPAVSNEGRASPSPSQR
ncbi:unnamed protein product [Pylaiella littoralis]